MAAGLDPLLRDHLTTHSAEGRGVSLVQSEVAGRGRPALPEQRSDRRSGLYLLANILWLTIVGWQT